MSDYLNYEVTADGVMIREPDTENLVFMVTPETTGGGVRYTLRNCMFPKPDKAFRKLEAAKYAALSEWIESRP